MIFKDITTVLVAAGALLIGLIAGNMRGEQVGYDKGYRVCQGENRTATDAANKRTADAMAALQTREDQEEAAELAALAELARDENEECRDLTPAERQALDRIGAE